MALHDFTSQRLYLEAPLAAGARLPASADQANYLRNVLRMKDGARLLVFNGQDGEWAAQIALAGKRGVELVIAERTRHQQGGPDVHYLFAPLKRARLDYMVQKATEMGVARITPVLTRHTVAERVNSERMRANIIEAAEQCGVLRLPEVGEPVRLEALLAGWDGRRHLVFCDEGAEVSSPLAALATLQERHGRSGPPPVALLIGPEGGFAEDERRRLLTMPSTLRLSLGPRIMRADTAAVAALALINAVLGDWR